MSKNEKKRLKAQIKLEKAKSKNIIIPQAKTGKWYKNPDWIRAIASIVAIILTLIGFMYFK